MRARIRSAAYSPRAPRVIAQTITEGLGVLSAAGVIVLIVTGIPSTLAAQAFLTVCGAA